MIAINILILLLLISFSLHNLLSEEAGELRVHFQCGTLPQLGSMSEKKYRHKCHFYKKQNPTSVTWILLQAFSKRALQPFTAFAPNQGLRRWSRQENQGVLLMKTSTMQPKTSLSIRNIYFPVLQLSKENFGPRGKLLGKLWCGDASQVGAEAKRGLEQGQGPEQGQGQRPLLPQPRSGE